MFTKIVYLLALALQGMDDSTIPDNCVTLYKKIEAIKAARNYSNYTDDTMHDVLTKTFNGLECQDLQINFAGKKRFPLGDFMARGFVVFFNHPKSESFDNAFVWGESYKSQRYCRRINKFLVQQNNDRSQILTANDAKVLHHMNNQAKKLGCHIFHDQVSYQAATLHDRKPHQWACYELYKHLSEDDPAQQKSCSLYSPFVAYDSKTIQLCSASGTECTPYIPFNHQQEIK